MDAPAEEILRSTPDAAWLPQGGRADVVASRVAPTPAGLVRLLIRRGTAVFCVHRDGAGKLDLPTRTVPVSDPDGRATARQLAFDVLGTRAEVTPLGFVRNIVASPTDDYAWPVPLAHFTVWGAEGEPAIAGAWVGVHGPDSVLKDRHWFPLVSAAHNGASVNEF